MNARAKLIVVLKADETVVAEIEDPILWQKVLSSIHGAPFKVGETIDDKTPSRNPTISSEMVGEDFDGDKSLVQFAKRLNLTPDLVQGALSPSKEPPYLHLDDHSWEKFRKAIPPRGMGAIPPIAIAGTILALWLKESGLGITATQGLTSQVLDTINVKDPNPSRGIRNTTWLQPRAGGVIILNPAEISQAVKVTRGFCLGKAPEAE